MVRTERRAIAGTLSVKLNDIIDNSAVIGDDEEINEVAVAAQHLIDFHFSLATVSSHSLFRSPIPSYATTSEHCGYYNRSQHTNVFLPCLTQIYDDEGLSFSEEKDIHSDYNSRENVGCPYPKRKQMSSILDLKCKGRTNTRRSVISKKKGRITQQYNKFKDVHHINYNIPQYNSDVIPVSSISHSHNFNYTLSSSFQAPLIPQLHKSIYDGVNMIEAFSPIYRNQEVASEENNVCSDTWSNSYYDGDEDNFLNRCCSIHAVVSPSTSVSHDNADVISIAENALTAFCISNGENNSSTNKDVSSEIIEEDEATVAAKLLNAMSYEIEQNQRRPMEDHHTDAMNCVSPVVTQGFIDSVKALLNAIKASHTHCCTEILHAVYNNDQKDHNSKKRVECESSTIKKLVLAFPKVNKNDIVHSIDEVTSIQNVICDICQWLKAHHEYHRVCLEKRRRFLMYQRIHGRGSGVENATVRDIHAGKLSRTPYYLLSIEKDDESLWTPTERSCIQKGGASLLQALLVSLV